MRSSAEQVMFCDKVAKVMPPLACDVVRSAHSDVCAAHKVDESGKPRNATFPLNNFMVQNKNH